MRQIAIVNANIITMDPDRSRVEAILTEEGRFRTMGSSLDIRNEIQSVDDNIIIDAGGRTVVPGLIDVHLHPLLYGFSKTMIDLRTPPVRSLQDIYEKIRIEVRDKKPGEWVMGVNFDETKLPTRTPPTLQELDNIAPENPVFLIRYCGHNGVANTRALEAAGVTPGMLDPPGGSFERDEKGNFTGYMTETARLRVRQAMPQKTPQEVKTILRSVYHEFARLGMTTIGDGMIREGRGELVAYQELARELAAPIRVVVDLDVALLPHIKALQLLPGFGNDYLQLGGLKILLDGVMTGRTAALSLDYNGVQPRSKGSRGILLYTQEELENIVEAVHEAGFQVSIHAIGDAAIDMAITAIERAQKTYPRGDPRHRIIHCGVCPPQLTARIRNAGIIPVPQPIFIYGDGLMYKENLPEELGRWSYPIRSFLDHGLRVPGSTDCPAVSADEPLNPFVNMWAAITRNLYEGGQFHPEQGITVEETLRMYTIYSAYANFQEDSRGSITVGKLADFVVLSNDPLTCPIDEIRKIKPISTVIGGKIAYKDPEFTY